MYMIIFFADGLTIAMLMILGFVFAKAIFGVIVMILTFITSICSAAYAGEPEAPMAFLIVLSAISFMISLYCLFHLGEWFRAADALL